MRRNLKEIEEDFWIFDDLEMFLTKMGLITKTGKFFGKYTWNVFQTHCKKITLKRLRAN